MRFYVCVQPELSCDARYELLELRADRSCCFTAHYRYIYTRKQLGGQHKNCFFPTIFAL